MQSFLGLIFCVVAVAVMFFLMLWKRHIVKKTYTEFAEKDFSYTLCLKADVRNEETVWVDKLILHIGSLLADFSQEDLLGTAFTVIVESEYEGAAQKSATAHTERTVTNVYPSDIDGNLLSWEEAEGHLVLELAGDASDSFCQPYIYDSVLLKKREKSVYAYRIEHKRFPCPLTVCNAPLIAGAPHRSKDQR